MEEPQRIKILPESVKTKIAAGEVVEGPFSVIKELVENSLDAGATNIDVQLLQSGLRKISVSDNGVGIQRDDVLLALKDHATSKIRDVHDIEGITTYGFRGEALSSIASISDITLLTRRENEKTGSRVQSRGGKTERSDWAGPPGTTIIIENLFYNVPARKKFLKSPQTELRYGRETFLKAAIANPAVGFTFDTDQKRRISLTSDESYEDRLKNVYGEEIVNNCYFEELRDLKTGIFGMLSKPDFLKSSRTMQLLFINGRPIEYRYLSFLLSKAYEAVAIHGKYPAAILFLEIAPELVDVNIHPAKREVKLFDSKYIDSLIMQLASKALNKIHSIGGSGIKPVFSDAKTMASGNVISSVTQGQGIQNHTERQHEDNNGYLFKPSGSAVSVKDAERLYSELVSTKDYQILGSVFSTYILIQKEDKLYLIDFHAAHERFIYDALIQANVPKEKQELLFPTMLELPIDEFNIIMDNLEIFSKIGFDIDEFSDNSIIIRSVPALVKKLNEKELIKEIAETIKEERKNDLVYDRIAALTACHSANRAGDSLSIQEMSILAEKVFSGEHELRCPHGRPFVHVITKDDLERIFKR